MPQLTYLLRSWTIPVQLELNIIGISLFMHVYMKAKRAVSGAKIDLY